MWLIFTTWLSSIKIIAIFGKRKEKLSGLYNGNKIYVIGERANRVPAHFI